MAFHCIRVVRRGQVRTDTIGSLDLQGQERSTHVLECIFKAEKGM